MRLQERVKEYIQKLKQLTQPKGNGLSLMLCYPFFFLHTASTETPSMVLDKQAANRFIQHAINSANAGA